MTQYPENAVRILRPHIQPAIDAAIYHFRRRHDGRGFGPARMWIKAVRRLDESSGYSEALRLIKQKLAKATGGE